MQISQFGVGGIDELLDPSSHVGRQIVHDDDIPWREGWNQTFLHPFLEQGGVHRPVAGLRGHKPSKARDRRRKRALEQSLDKGSELCS